jgi:hypothetical protein
MIDVACTVEINLEGGMRSRGLKERGNTRKDKKGGRKRKVEEGRGKDKG